MDLLQEAHSISPRLASWLQEVGEQPFSFAGENPLDHSKYNHIHLWMLEAEADDHPQITLAFRCRVISFIFERWKQRLKGYHPYQEAGFRLFLYEDMAPTISVANLARGSLTNRYDILCKKMRLLKLELRPNSPGSLFLRKGCEPVLQAASNQISLHSN